MPVRLRITLLFSLVAIVILGIVGVGVYYFSSMTRIEAIKTRLTNRAITTAKFLEQTDYFSPEVIRRIDSSTTLSLKRKSVQAYNSDGVPAYYYAEVPGDTLKVEAELLKRTREKGRIFFKENSKEVIAYHYDGIAGDKVVVCAGVDVEGKTNLSDLRKVLLFCFAGGVLISLIGGYVFSGQLLRPIKRIANEVKDISAYSLDRRIQTTENPDEWNALANTLNELLDRLKESFELQRRFIANASHELSTPLTLISSQIEISLQRHRTDEEYRLVMNSVLQDVRHMSNLVQTLLRFASASGNPGGLNIELLRIDEVLMRLPAEMQKKGKEQKVTLIFNDLPENENSLLVLGNEDLLFTAISNIVSNACKYSDDHHAEVELVLTGFSFVIHVRDKGIGIEEKDLEKIFQPFYRLDEARGVGGFGLGLSLASRIIKMHKGTIKVQSTTGEGSTFTIELPGS